MNIVTLNRAMDDALENRYLHEDEYRLLVVLLVAKADGWIMDKDAEHELDRLLAKTKPARE